MAVNHGLRAYQDLAPISDIPDEHLREVLAALFEYLGVEIVRECTPDYTAYEIRKRD